LIIWNSLLKIFFQYFIICFDEAIAKSFAFLFQQQAQIIFVFGGTFLFAPLKASAHHACCRYVHTSKYIGEPVKLFAFLSHGADKTAAISFTRRP
jgi:hypothetical protein